MGYFPSDRPRRLMLVVAPLLFAAAACAEDGAPIEFVPQVGHASGMFGVFSPDGSRVLSGSDDTTLKLWVAGTGSSSELFVVTPVLSLPLPFHPTESACCRAAMTQRSSYGTPIPARSCTHFQATPTSLIRWPTLRTAPALRRRLGTAR